MKYIKLFEDHINEDDLVEIGDLFKELVDKYLLFQRDDGSDHSYEFEEWEVGPKHSMGPLSNKVISHYKLIVYMCTDVDENAEFLLDFLVYIKRLEDIGYVVNMANIIPDQLINAYVKKVELSWNGTKDVGKKLRHYYTDTQIVEDIVLYLRNCISKGLVNDPFYLLLVAWAPLKRVFKIDISL